MDPLFAFAFLQSFVEILQEYFGTVSAATLKDNFDVVYQVTPLLPSFCLCYEMTTTILFIFTAPRRNPRFRRAPTNHLTQRLTRHRSTSFSHLQAPRKSIYTRHVFPVLVFPPALLYTLDIRLEILISSCYRCWGCWTCHRSRSIRLPHSMEEGGAEVQ